jgi:outer membrane protein assembly factor BamB
MKPLPPHVRLARTGTIWPLAMLPPRVTWPMLFTALFWAAWAGPTAADDWTRFRGPNGSGIGQAENLPATWTADDYRWRVELPAIGYSSPVVQDERIFVTSADEDDATQTILCLRTTDGKQLWTRQFPSITHSKHRFNCYASATPAVDVENVYFVWANPEAHVVVALDQETGKEQWRRDFGPYLAEHGFGASPIVFERLLIVTADRDEDCFVAALDCASGEVVWKVPREVERAAYATPMIYRGETDRPQLILASSAHGVSGHDPYSGKTYWQVQAFDLRVVGSPMMASGLIFASCGSGGTGKRTVAVRPGDTEGEQPAEIAYDVKGSLPYVPVPVAYEEKDLVFIWSDHGIVQCLDAPSGEVHWKERVGGQFFGSPVRVGERLYCISREGTVFVLAAADEYELLGKVDLGEPSNSSPAVADGVMYLRTVSHLMALEGR